jgi:hypothetical protein
MSMTTSMTIIMTIAMTMKNINSVMSRQLAQTKNR